MSASRVQGPGPGLDKAGRSAPGGTQKGSGRLGALDGVRGIAILLVLVWHYFVSQVHPQSGAVVTLQHAGSLTWSGVDLFFVLSGFLIGGILLDNRSSNAFFKTFYIRRACRIMPAYLVMVAAFELLLHATSGAWKFWLFDNPPAVWSYLTFTQNYVHRSGFDANFLGVTWSLAVEEQFYLLVPLAVFLLRGRALLLFLLPGIALGPFLRSVFSFPGDYTYAFCRTDGLLIGVLLAWLVRRPGVVELVRRYRPVFIVAFALLFWQAVRMTQQSREPGGVFVHLWLAGLYGTVVLGAFVFRGGVVGNVLGARWLTWFGARSYAIYLLHQAVSGLYHSPYRPGENPAMTNGAEVGLTLAALATTLVLADISYRTLEARFIALGRRWRYRIEPGLGLDVPAPERSSTTHRNCGKREPAG